jgi:RES domain-containing protein
LWSATGLASYMVHNPRTESLNQRARTSKVISTRFLPPPSAPLYLSTASSTAWAKAVQARKCQDPTCLTQLQCLVPASTDIVSSSSRMSHHRPIWYRST